MSGMSDRVSGAPISWGVCEVPGWGVQLPADRVLAEMAQVGLRATELGPVGFLPADASDAAALLRRHGLRAVAGFVPVVLHRPDRLAGELAALDRRAAELARARAEILVLAAATGREGYEEAGDLEDAEWDWLVAGIAEASEVGERHGLVTVLHPHHGTVVERTEHIARLLSASPVGLCLDTGHLVIGGADPVALAAEAADRIRHVHLKDVDATLAGKVRVGAIGYRNAVAAGLFRPLGRGGVDVRAIVRSLEQAGYAGWYVLERDTVLSDVPATGTGPVEEEAASVEFMSALAAA